MPSDTVTRVNVRTDGPPLHAVSHYAGGLLPIVLVVGLLLMGGALLIWARSLLVPFAVALLIWLVINAFARVLSDRIRLGGAALPAWAALTLSLLTCVTALAMVGQLMADNLQAMAAAAPRYQAGLEAVAQRAASALGMASLPEFVALLDGQAAETAILAITNGIAGLIGDAGTILIYLAFLLIEQRVLRPKLLALFPEKGRRAEMVALAQRLQSKVQTYLATKSATSLLMGLATYGVTAAVGLDFAGFWGFMAFLANFVPVIGGLVSLVLPALLALIAFPTITPFLIVAAGIGAAHLLIGNVLEPQVVGRSVNLSPLTVILALSIWGFLWGIAGMFLCIPLTVIAMIVCAQFESTRGIAIALSERGEVD